MLCRALKKKYRPNTDLIRKMFKKLIKISYHPVGLGSSKSLSILKPCGCHPRQSRSLNHTLESVKLAEVNRKANYHPPAGKKNNVVQVEQIAVDAFSCILESEHFHTETD